MNWREFLDLMAVTMAVVLLGVVIYAAIRDHYWPRRGGSHDKR